VVLPLSILGTFGPMYLLGYSIDNLSLMALTIATGFVVDDAVVVLENIVRHLETGADPLEAALRGSAEVSFTVISMSLSLIAVFIPILLMPGIVGLLFHEFAVTLSIAILFSLLISLTVTPTMCAYLLGRAGTLHSKARWATWADAQFERFKAAYSRSLTAVLDHAPLVGLVLIGLIVLNVALFRLVPSTFFPEQDNGLLIGQIIADQSISFQAMEKKLQQLQHIVHSETPGAAARFGRSSGSAAASQAQPRLRRSFVSAGGSGSAHRWPAIGRRIPIHVDQRGYGRPVRMDAQARGRTQQGSWSTRGRQFGFAAERPADLCHHQS
jgi:multidrug efflux pump